MLVEHEREHTCFSKKDIQCEHAGEEQADIKSCYTETAKIWSANQALISARIRVEHSLFVLVCSYSIINMDI